MFTIGQMQYRQNTVKCGRFYTSIGFATSTHWSELTMTVKLNRAAVVLAPTLARALYVKYFLIDKRSLEGAPGPELEFKFLPDTTKPGEFNSGYYTSGPWGRQKLGGTDFPDRWLLTPRGEK